MGFLDTYAPIKFVNSNPLDIDEFTFFKEQLIEAGCKKISDISEDEFILFCVSDNFFDPKYTGEYKDINNAMIKIGLNIFTKFKLTEDYFKKANVIAEVRDMFLMPLLIDKWSRNKQIYKPDKDFANALLMTENLEISRYMLENLPYNHFYVDLSECEVFKPIDGFFMHIVHLENGCNITIYLLQQTEKEVIFFSYYNDCKYNDKDIISFDINKMYNVDIDKDFNIFPNMVNEAFVNKDYKLNRAQITLFGLQLLAYLSSKDPQVQESYFTKNTYKKPDPHFRPKNKFSELRMWEVGTKYGLSYRQQIKKHKNYKINGRKSPIPHLRRAHWQRYWVGRGRINCITKWIEPTFVNASDN